MTKTTRSLRLEVDRCTGSPTLQGAQADVLADARPEREATRETCP